MRWGEKLEFEQHANPGDFIFVPPFVPHQEINASNNEILKCVLFRSGQDPVVVNLDIPEADEHNEKYWIDDIHREKFTSLIVYGFFYENNIFYNYLFCINF